MRTFFKKVKDFFIYYLKRFLPEPVKKVIRGLLHLGEKKIIAENKAILKDILGQTQHGFDQYQYRTLIIFPPSLDWDVQLFQRPQQLAIALAKRGALVFYIQPKPDRKQPPFQRISNGLYLCNVHVDTFQDLENPIIYLLTWNSAYASRFKEPKIIYDFVDDVNVFYGDQDQIRKGHQLLLKKSTLVLATARKLVKEASEHRPDVIFSPNGVEYEHFSKAAQNFFSAPPEDLKPILQKSNPIIGYYGALARWFDYQLLKSIAHLRPDYEFVLIGPDYDGTLSPARLATLTNIHWLGVKPYAELPHYLQFFDVATIPFLVNDITHAVSPLKLFEYMAGEKPVVITPMQESMHYTGVLVAENAKQFVDQIDNALKMRKDQDYLDHLQQIARENTWEQRAEDIIQAIRDRV